jgi:hypothetical protein
LPRVRAAAASSPVMSAATVAKLSVDLDWHVRAALAANKTVPRLTLRALTHDDDVRVAAAARRTLQTVPFA